jgi:hypothetical protein
LTSAVTSVTVVGVTVSSTTGGEWTVSLAYVAGVMAVMAVATTDPNHPKLGLFVTALVLCLPAMVPALPLFYVALALVWGLSHADSGGATWPVTMAYVAAAGLAAVGNLWLIRRLRRMQRTPRHA